LPLAFHTDLNSIPGAIPYLKAQEDLKVQWAQRLGAKARPRVGLTWSGSPHYKGDPQRSIGLADLKPFLPDRCDYYCLQKEVRETDREHLLRSEIVWFQDDLAFPNTAALMELMDVVVSTDTSIPHLSAALGRPTWLLLCRTPDWRWLLGRDDSPWYPSMRLFRQQDHTGWPSTLAELRAALLSI
jgi:hypothetical protein